MAAADMTVDGMWATVEAEETVHTLTIKDAVAAVTNIGSEDIFLSMTGEDTIPTDGLQHNGVIVLSANDSIHLINGTPAVKYRCAAGKTSKFWYSPCQG